MADLIDRKMEIAEKAGELQAEIKHLERIANRIERSKTAIGHNFRRYPEALSVEIWFATGKEEVLKSGDIDPDGSGLHDALLQFLNKQTEKFKTQLDELIKIPQ